ncbi:MAG: tetratricopeptide repeat protein, partial [Gammaproteobacteria bacterium]|nr:tetratricopeptide repeat protein [Gammaproteobacteria bacterium]
MALSLFEELKRRNVFKVATAYLVLAWVVVQVTSEAVPAFNMPEWVNTVVFFLGAIGFPFVLLFAWAFELTPEGLKRESEVPAEQSITDTTGQKLNYVIIGLLSVALTYFVYESRFQNTESDVVVDSQQKEEKLATESEQVQAIGASIAVLPFVNMSSDPEQEYFSDGISEEILNVLAQIPNLQVTSRSSAFAFKDMKINISEVAKKLGVENVLEGSVRTSKSGDRVRVTAQLIEAKTDKHLWSETYDRDLDDIFAIQDEISQAIVNSLKEKLNIQANEQVTVASAQKVNLEAHQAYLKGRFYIKNRNQKDLELALVQFDKAIALEPGYAQAWVGKAWANIFLSELGYGDTPTLLAVERAQSAIDRAFKLDPDNAEAYGVQGLIYRQLQDNDQAAENYEKALELNPNNALVHSWYANTQVNDYAKQFELYKRSYQLDPINILVGTNYARALLQRGQIDNAAKVIQQLYELNDTKERVDSLNGLLLQEKGEFGKATYYYYLAYQQNKTTTNRFDYADKMARLGFNDEVAEALNGSEFYLGQHLLIGNPELFISEARARFPRSANDKLGFEILGMAAFLNQDFKVAIENFNKGICQNCPDLLMSYKKAGLDNEFEDGLQ